MSVWMAEGKLSDGLSVCCLIITLLYIQCERKDKVVQIQNDCLLHLIYFHAKCHHMYDGYSNKFIYFMLFQLQRNL